MNINVISIRYAKALIKLTGTGEEIVKQNLDVFEGLTALFSIKEALSILKSPVMPISLKSELFAAVFQKSKAGTSFIQFIEVILAANRTHLIPEIHQAYKMQIDDIRNQVHAIVTSSESMNEGQKSKMQKALEHIFDKEVVVSYAHQPDLLGGFVAKVGHYQIDCSLRTRIETIISNVAATSGAS